MSKPELLFATTASLKVMVGLANEIVCSTSVEDEFAAAGALLSSDDGSLLLLSLLRIEHLLAPVCVELDADSELEVVLDAELAWLTAEFDLRLGELCTAGLPSLWPWLSVARGVDWAMELVASLLIIWGAPTGLAGFLEMLTVDEGCSGPAEAVAMARGAPWAAGGREVCKACASRDAMAWEVSALGLNLTRGGLPDGLAAFVAVMRG